MGKKTTVRILSATLAIAIAGTAAPAQAQTLFDLLFQKKRQRERVIREPVRPKPVTQAARKPVKKVTVAPARYYAYHATKPVTFAAGEIALADSAEQGPLLRDDHFVEALRLSADMEVMADRSARDAILAYYAKTPEFIWVDGYAPNDRAKAAMAVFKDAAKVGLEPRDYGVELPGDGFDLANTADRLRRLMRFELAMSAAALRYAHDAMNGRITPNKLSDYHDLEPKPFDGAQVLASLDGADDIADRLRAFNPSSKRFAMLAAELQRLRAEAGEDDLPVIPPKTLIRPGQDDPQWPNVVRLVARVLADDLTEEQRVLLYENRDVTVYDQALVPLVKAAQKARGVGADGIVGPRTVAAMQGQTNAQKLRATLYAMERLRWLPTDFGSRYVFINQPAFWASYMEGDQEKLGMRVVVGKRANQTNFFYDEIEYVEYNPYWGVPRSILVNEMLPKLQRDPSYLDRIGYEVFSGNRRVSSSSVDWWNGGANRVSVRQPPSEKNALGELKIMFPNKHNIYMHDTPSKSLFSRDVRAFSHGCVRLQQPREMAAAVLGTDLSEIRQGLANGHNRSTLDKPVPVYVAYFTAWPSDTGTVEFYSDIYGRDDRLQKAIEATGAARETALPEQG